MRTTQSEKMRWCCRSFLWRAENQKVLDLAAKNSVSTVPRPGLGLVPRQPWMVVWQVVAWIPGICLEHFSILGPWNEVFNFRSSCHRFLLFLFCRQPFQAPVAWIWSRWQHGWSQLPSDLHSSGWTQSRASIKKCSSSESLAPQFWLNQFQEIYGPL